MSPVTIDRLDYSKPPRLYLERSSDPQEEAALFADPAYEACYLGMTRGESLLAAWTHYKTHNDPPGFFVTGDEEADAGQGNAAWILPEGLTSDSAVAYHDGFTATSAARAAAWAWYDRRLVLWHRLAQEQAALMAVLVGCSPTWHSPNCWPHCLAWTDEQVGQTERALEAAYG